MYWQYAINFQPQIFLWKGFLKHIYNCVLSTAKHLHKPYTVLNFILKLDFTKQFPYYLKYDLNIFLKLSIIHIGFDFKCNLNNRETKQNII